MSLGQIIHRILHSIDAQVEHESENISPFSAEIRDAAGGLRTTVTDTLNFHANILPIHIRLNRSVFNAAARLVTRGCRGGEHPAVFQRKSPRN
ncbi:hypothetical protein B0H13DRAFT_2316680 [Mycena leptocephala]|nr:hypothetical protein B0H13DRAFT_2316680 [Mycena leptocephala]